MASAKRGFIWESEGGGLSGFQGQTPWAGGQGDAVPLKLRRIYKFRVKSLNKIVPFMSVLSGVHRVRNCDKKLILNTTPMETCSNRSMRNLEFPDSSFGSPKWRRRFADARRLYIPLLFSEQPITNCPMADFDSRKKNRNNTSWELLLLSKFVT